MPKCLSVSITKIWMFLESKSIVHNCDGGVRMRTFMVGPRKLGENGAQRRKGANGSSQARGEWRAKAQIIVKLCDNLTS